MVSCIFKALSSFLKPSKFGCEKLFEAEITKFCQMLVMGGGHIDNC